MEVEESIESDHQPIKVVIEAGRSRRKCRVGRSDRNKKKEEYGMKQEKTS